MHTEHLENVRPGGVMFGWFVSVAVVSAVALGLAATGLVDREATDGGGFWGVLAIAVGFGVGGWFTGFRTGAAPILHGIAIGVVSLLLWFVVNLVFGEALGATEWLGGSVTYYAGMLILQMAAAALGARIGSRGRRMAVREQVVGTARE